MDRKYLQLPRFIAHQEKKNAVLLAENEINKDVSKYRDGEEIIVEYKAPDGRQMYSTAVIRKENGVAKLYIAIEESETLRIVDSEEEPSDKNVLWVTEDDSSEGESGSTEDLRAEIESLKSVIKKMQSTVERHDYALSSTIAGGDIVLNSEKYAMENETDPEKPEDATDNTEYAEDRKSVV